MSESQFIGVIVGANSGNIYAVISPDDDRELDNPRLLLLQASAPAFRPVEPSRYNLTDENAPVVQFFEVNSEEKITREPMRLMRVPRGDYMGALSMADVAALVAKLDTA